MGYPIEIGVTVTGQTIIGAKDCAEYRKAGHLAGSEKVYGSQIGHRCAALLPSEGWSLLTPTLAKELGATEIRRFPDRQAWWGLRHP